MAESLSFPKTDDRARVYAALYPQLEAMIQGENDWIANSANFVAALREAFGFLVRL